MRFHPHGLLIALVIASAPGLTRAAAEDNQDVLDAYVARLRLDHAGPRRETGFLSAGSDFLYGQDSFDAGNYTSAASSFRDAVRKDPQNAFAHYQLALALLRQDDEAKRREAQPSLESAFRLNPALRERFRRDVPEASAAKPAPPAREPAADPPATRENRQPAPGYRGEPQTQAAANPARDSLADYVARLKRSRSAGGPETGMNTAGQAALYAIEHYEAHDYRAAETNFHLARALDAQNPHVNYLLAVSLGAQGKDAEAAPYLRTAFAAEPALQQRHAGDLAAARAAWQKTVAASTPKPGPAAAPTGFGGPLVFGNYVCSVTVWNGPNATPAFRSDYQGYFELKADGTYRWLDDGATGRYRYDPATGGVEWLSGHFKGQPRVSRFQKDGRSGLITLEFSDTYRWRCYREVK